MLRVTFTGFFAHKMRFALTAMSIALGIALLSGTLIYGATINRTFDDMFASVNTHVDFVVRSTDVTESTYGDQRSPVDLALVDRISGIPGVAAASADVMGYAQVVDKTGNALGGFGPPTYGLAWPKDEILNPYTNVLGRGPGAGEIVLDKGTSDKGHFQIGDTIRVLTRGAPETFTLVGVIKFGSADSPAGATLAIVDLDTAMRLFGAPGKVDDISIAATDDADKESLQRDIVAVLPAGEHLEVVTGDQLTKESQDAVASGMSFLTTFLTVFALIALFVSTFIIYNTFSIIVAQRTKELGLLRALGASRRQIVGSVLAEAVLLGVAASVIGTLGGAFLALGLKAMMSAVGFNLPTTALTFPAGSLAWCVAAGASVTIVAAVLPARRASVLAPIEAMRGDAGMDRAVTARRVVLGGLATAAGIGAMLVGLVAQPDNAMLFIGVGAATTFIGVATLAPTFSRPVSRLLGAPFAALGGEPGHLAQENAVRSPRRTASTAAALMVGVALVGTISTVAASTKASTNEVIDRTLRADFIVTPKGGVGVAVAGFTPDVGSKLNTSPEVAAASPLRISLAKVDGTTDVVAAVDPETIERVVDLGVISGAIVGMPSDGIAVSERAAKENGWQLGQSITVDYSTEQHATTRISAIFENRDVAGDLFVPMSVADAHFHEQLDALVIVKLNDGVSASDGRAAIERVTNVYENIALMDQTQYKAQQQASVDQLLAMVYALLFLAVIIAVLGIANTLALSVHERRRELGLLRAVGMTRLQIARAVGFESIVIAVFGAALGLVVGGGFGVAFVLALRDDGVGQLVVPFDSGIAIAVVAVIAGVVASLGPARHAGRVDILKAVSAE